MDNLACLFDIAIVFIDLNQLLSALGILSLEHHLALGALTQHSQHVESLFSGREGRQEFSVDELDHIGNGLLCLTAALNQHREPLTYFSKLFVGPG